MPIYEYECGKCKNTFEASMSIKDKGNIRVTCPKCKSDDVNQIFNGVNINAKSTAGRKSNGCCGGSGCCR